MRNPCKKCIVRASCSERCRESEIFIEKASSAVTFFAMVFASLTLGPFLLYIATLIDKEGYEWIEISLVMMWIISFIVCTLIQSSFDKDQQISNVALIILAPYCAIIYTIFHITKPYCQSSYKKRR